MFPDRCAGGWSARAWGRGRPGRPPASDERIVELWLRDRPANTRVAYERDYGRFRAFIGARSLRTVGLGDLSDFAATVTGSAATRRRTLSAIKALLTTGFKMGALRFNVGAALRLPKVVSRHAERRLEEIELFRLLTAVEGKPRDRAIIEALYGTGARVDELVQLKRKQLVADIDGPGGYVTLYGKHGGRTIRVGRRTWDAEHHRSLPQFGADGRVKPLFKILTPEAAGAFLRPAPLPLPHCRVFGRAKTLKRRQRHNVSAALPTAMRRSSYRRSPMTSPRLMNHLWLPSFVTSSSPHRDGDDDRRPP